MKFLSVSKIFVGLSLIFCMGSVEAQTWISKENLKCIARQVLSGGKAERIIVQDRSVYLRARKGKVFTEVYIDKYETVENAKLASQAANRLLDEALGGRGHREIIPIGDEGVLWTNFSYVGESSLSFRRGELRVKIESAGQQNVRQLAGKLDEVLSSRSGPSTLCRSNH